MSPFTRSGHSTRLISILATWQPSCIPSCNLRCSQRCCRSSHSRVQASKRAGIEDRDFRYQVGRRSDRDRHMTLFEANFFTKKGPRGGVACSHDRSENVTDHARLLDCFHIVVREQSKIKTKVALRSRSMRSEVDVLLTYTCAALRLWRSS